MPGCSRGFRVIHTLYSSDSLANTVAAMVSPSQSRGIFGLPRRARINRD
jgi:hypothetical protein